MKIDVLDKGSVELLKYMGGDLDIVNDARVSHSKQSEAIDERDKRLIRFLIKHDHKSPLRGTVLKFRIKAPLAICRQIWKHHVASCHSEEQQSWNERSFRYVEVQDSSDYYIPNQFRGQSKTNKQASDDILGTANNQLCRELFRNNCKNSYRSYQTLISTGVSREQARMILPPAFYTEWIWTVSLEALLNFIYLRSGGGAQLEIQEYANALIECVKIVAPIATEAWLEKYINGK